MSGAGESQEQRMRVLVYTAARASEMPMRLLSRHPEAALLRARLEGREAACKAWPIDELLWANLTSRERVALPPMAQGATPSRGTAGQYYQRRRVLQDWIVWRAARDRIPRAWLAVLEMSAAEVERCIVHLGREGLARAWLGAGSQRVEEWAPLLSPMEARQVIDRMGQLSPQDFPPDLAADWRTRFLAMAAGREKRLARMMGRHMLARYFATLPEQDRESSRRIAHSTVLAALEKLGPQRGLDEMEYGCVEEMLGQVVRQLAVPRKNNSG